MPTTSSVIVRFWVCTFLATVVLASGLFSSAATTLAADGIQDNIPDNVRRIPKPGVEVPADRAAAMKSRLSILQQKLNDIRSAGKSSATALLPDVMIFERAVRCALEFDEFFDIKDLDKADALLVEGIARADQLLAGTPQWPGQSGLVVRGYISRIDHTVQPYGLVVPETYSWNQSVPTRCDIWFHGRGETLSEVNFLWDRLKTPGQFTPEHTIVLHPYGRYCNAFKFAGEVDVLEALEDVQHRYRIDKDRISVRGFSMGGAACWQFATHYPDRWFAANPGAGFSETPLFLKVFQQEELKPTKWEQTLWNLYDCDKWALNLTHCPTIAYSGELDKQKQAADVMETALATYGIRLRHIIGSQMGHKIDDPSKEVIETGMTSLAKAGRQSVPETIDFTTHSLRYNRMHWVTVEALGEHWSPAIISADLRPGFRGGVLNSGSVPIHHVEITCSNIQEFSLNFAAGECPIPIRNARLRVRIADGGTDAQTALQPNGVDVHGPASDGSWNVRFRRVASTGDRGSESAAWTVVDESAARSGKRHGLQGPIDDAFMDSFVFVRPTGMAGSEAVGQWADNELSRAIEHWRRHFRGDARVVNDTDVTDEQIASANLILWGDPSSNAVIKRVAENLPIQWADGGVKVGQKSFDASHHAPILIHPNPLNPSRYVVLNSSFTFRDYAYLNNARQVPMLPDWAIIDVRTKPSAVWPGQVVAADFFDEEWKLKQ